MSDLIVHHVEQGSDEWHRLRRSHCCSSDAPAMMGVSRYKSRSALLAEMRTGEAAQPAASEYILERGHQAERAARTIADQIIGEEMYPAVMSRTIDGIPMLASLDGITMSRSMIWEHKLASARLLEQIEAQELEPHYYWQLEHQLAVTGAGVVLFMASSPTSAPACMHYRSQPERRQELIDGWRQLLSERHAVSVPVQIDISPTLATADLVARCAAAIAVIEELPSALESESDYAAAEDDVKWLKGLEAQAKAGADAVMHADADLALRYAIVTRVGEVARASRLSREKAIKGRKADIVAAEIDRAMQAIEVRYGIRMAAHEARLREAVKGRRTRATVSAAAQDELAKIVTEGKPSAYDLWLDQHGITDEQMAEGIRLRNAR